MAKYELIATATMGLESLVAREVKDLGFENVRVENGKVTYES
ncbi:class I SAM-dependent RNA methyltransferase, partial [Planococcus sp. SIMBA_143]